jgi:hypothetical protein
VEEKLFPEPGAGLFAPVMEGSAASLAWEPGRAEFSDVEDLGPGTAALVAVPDESPSVNVFDGFEEADFKPCERPNGELDDGAESEVGTSWDQFPR